MIKIIYKLKTVGHISNETKDLNFIMKNEDILEFMAVPKLCIDKGYNFERVDGGSNMVYCNRDYNCQYKKPYTNICKSSIKRLMYFPSEI